MRIQHNIMAMNAYRNYTNNTSALSKNLEKLSSGYKINRAGDDAAGLAISEKMRAQITGLKTAQKNAKDGISLVQTAEGALTEVHDMLNRMVELADQSANGTYDNDVDRANLQKEFDALRTEIDRIADSSNFNGINLLDGKLGIASSAVNDITTEDYEAAQTSPAFETSFINARPAAVTVAVSASFTVSLDDVRFSSGTGSHSGDSASITLTIGGKSITITAGLSGNVTGGDIANAIVSAGNTYQSGALTTAAGDHIEIDGHIYKMTVTTSTGGTGASVKFEQMDTSTMVNGEVVNPQFNVTINATAAGGGQYKGTLNPASQITQTGRGTGATQQARVDVDIDFRKLKDGDTLQVGDKTYVFKIGKDSTMTTTGAGVTSGGVLVDLSDVFKTKEDQSDTQLQKNALDKIVNTMSAGNDKWSAGAAPMNKHIGTITFQSNSTWADDGTYDMDTEKNVMDQFVVGSRPASPASATFDLDVSKIKVGDTLTLNGRTFEFTAGGEVSDRNNTAIDLGSFGVANGITAGSATSALNAITAAIGGMQYGGGSTSAMFDVAVDGTKITITAKDDGNTSAVDERETTPKVSWGSSTKGLTLQIGDTAADFNRLNVQIDDMHSKAMGIGKDNVNIDSQEAATAALQKIKDAINYVSSTRGDLGATQNRLEHTMNNLSVMQENIQDAESSIRDVDVAEEMMSYTKNNILVQSAQAMLAQANQVPQGVLQLLQ